MKDFKKIINEVSGEVQLQGAVKLVGDLSPNVLTLNNKNKTPYRLATVELPTNSGVKVVTAMVFQGNYEHENANFKDGGSYLATISKGDGRGVLVQMSHLSSANTECVSAKEFDFTEEGIEEKASVEA